MSEYETLNYFCFGIHISVHHEYISQVTTNKMKRFLIFFFIFTDALHISGSSSAHHQEHITVHTASGIGKQYYCYRG